MVSVGVKGETEADRRVVESRGALVSTVAVTS
jgi:hypothetical protein